MPLGEYTGFLLYERRRVCVVFIPGAVKTALTRVFPKNPRAEVTEKLMEKFQLSRDEAEGYMEKYWKR